MQVLQVLMGLKGPDFDPVREIQRLSRFRFVFTVNFASKDFDVHSALRLLKVDLQILE